MQTAAPIRVLVAKAGLDGHDRGAKIIARALRDAGMEVLYTGLRKTPESIVQAAIQEDVDCIGLSILSGAHNVLVPRLIALLKEQKAEDILVVLGGTIPQSDVPALEAMGVAAVFGPGTTLDAVVNFLRQRIKPKTADLQDRSSQSYGYSWSSISPCSSLSEIRMALRIGAAYRSGIRHFCMEASQTKCAVSPSASNSCPSRAFDARMIR